MTVEDTLLVFQIYALDQNKTHAEDVETSLQASDLCPGEAGHTC